MIGFRIPSMAVVKIIIDELYLTFGEISASQEKDSDGGEKITRQEIWLMITGLLFRAAPKIENVIMAKNGGRGASVLRWKILEIIANSLSELPSEFEDKKRDDGQINRQEAIEIIGNVLRKSIPEISKLDINEIK